MAKITTLQKKINRINRDIESLTAQIRVLNDVLKILEEPEPDIENGKEVDHE